MSKKISVIVIVGTTASGKSALAIRMAKKFNGEIISADSRQCYRSLDVGTAKVKGKWKNGIFLSNGVPHFCIDIALPKQLYTAATFKKDAENAIRAITARHHIPIIAGGTGFWIDTLIYDTDLPRVPPNLTLRRELEKKSPEQLFTMLKKIDSRRAATIEQKNSRRLIRAIEIARALGRVPLITQRHPYHTLWIGISRRDSALRLSIAARARQMVRQGLVEETKKLLAAGVSKKRIHEFGFEYTAALDVIEKKLMSDQLVETLIRETVFYAKRQNRWFCRNKKIQWVTSSFHAERYIKKFLNASI